MGLRQSRNGAALINRESIPSRDRYRRIDPGTQSICSLVRGSFLAINWSIKTAYIAAILDLGRLNCKFAIAVSATRAARSSSPPGLSSDPERYLTTRRIAA
jgi:hypothetical protein